MNTENEHSQTEACAADLEPDFAALIQGELPPERRSVLENHLVDCTQCRDVFNSYKNILGAVAQWEEQDVTEDFGTRLKDRIDNARKVRARLHERRRLMFKTRVLERPVGLKYFRQQCIRNAMPVAASIAVTVSFIIMAMNVDLSSKGGTVLATTNSEYIQHLRVERLVSRFRGEVRLVSYTPGRIPVNDMLPDGAIWTADYASGEGSEKCITLLSETQFAEYNNAVDAEKKGQGPFHTVGWAKLLNDFLSAKVEDGQALLPDSVTAKALAKTKRIAIVPMQDRVEIWRIENWIRYTGADLADDIDPGDYIVTPTLSITIEQPEDMMDGE